MRISEELFEVFDRDNFVYRKDDENSEIIKREYQSAQSKWITFVEAVRDKFNDKDYEVQGTESWQNSGNLTKRFWSRIKHKNRMNSSSCLALMINKGIFLAYLEWHNRNSEASTNTLKDHNNWIGNLDEWVNSISKYENHYKVWLQHDDEISENYIDLKLFLSNEELRNNLINETKASNKWLRIGDVFTKDEVLSWEDAENRIAKTLNEVKKLYAYTVNTNDIEEIKDRVPPENAEPEERRIWAYAPGRDGYKWDEFRETGIMAIDWNISDIREYPTKKSIADHLIDLDETKDNSHRNDSLALWQFCNEIQVGDKIFAKAGNKKLLGIGEVVSDYIYDDKREEFKHIRKVNWIKAGNWIVEEKFAIKTLTDITDYEEFCNKIEQLTSEQTMIEKRKSYSKQDFLSDVFISEEQYDTLKNLLLRKKNIILQGAPGVGKTFAAKRLAYSMMGEKNDQRVKLVQFHQSYSYEDFIMGYRPTAEGFSIKYGSFYNFCKQAEANPNESYFYIIDEINRGNLSKIFGELLMLIETDKRGEKINLTYEDVEFFVPSNLYMIGMMNTADRSLAIIDYALRRRFCFFELEPAFSSNSFREYLQKNNVKPALIDRIEGKLLSLNNLINEDRNLGSGFRIGHSYFCDCNQADDKWFEDIIKFEIAPLLEEYWFDDLNTAREHIEELLRL